MVKKGEPHPNKGKSNSLKGKPRVMTPAIIENPGGRPSLFDEAAPKIIQYVRNGNTFECASGCARISYDTFNRWMNQGKEDIKLGNELTKYCQFYKDVKQAERDCENEVLSHWLKQIPNNWQAAKEYLARRHHKSWGLKDKVDVTSNGETLGKPVFLPLKLDLDDEEP